MVECGKGEYYIWEKTADDIWRIDEPKDLGGILTALGSTDTREYEKGPKTTLLVDPEEEKTLEANILYWAKREMEENYAEEDKLGFSLPNQS